MTFVQLIDSPMNLFVGDCSSFTQSWQEQRGRPRFIETCFARENRRELFGGLGVIKALKATSAYLTIVSSRGFRMADWSGQPPQSSGRIFDIRQLIQRKAFALAIGQRLA